MPERRIAATRNIMGYSCYNVEYADINVSWDSHNYLRTSKSQTFEILKELVSLFKHWDVKVEAPCDSEIEHNMLIPNPYFTKKETYDILGNVFRHIKIRHGITPKIPNLSEQTTLFDIAVGISKQLYQKERTK